ncbi:hypothetical protein V8C42DRAFT_326856 [Trichoderma barbatum]
MLGDVANRGLDRYKSSSCLDLPVWPPNMQASHFVTSVAIRSTAGRRAAALSSTRMDENNAAEHVDHGQQSRNEQNVLHYSCTSMLTSCENCGILLANRPPRPILHPSRLIYGGLLVLQLETDRWPLVLRPGNCRPDSVSPLIPAAMPYFCMELRLNQALQRAPRPRSITNAPGISSKSKKKTRWYSLAWRIGHDKFDIHRSFHHKDSSVRRSEVGQSRVLPVRFQKGKTLFVSFRVTLRHPLPNLTKAADCF